MHGFDLRCWPVRAGAAMPMHAFRCSSSPVRLCAADLLAACAQREQHLASQHIITALQLCSAPLASSSLLYVYLHEIMHSAGTI